MKLEIAGQFRGPECRLIPKMAFAIRTKLEPMLQQVEVDGITTLSLILRVGGSLGEFAPAPSDGRPQSIQGALVYDVIIGNKHWESRSEAEIRAIVASHLWSGIKKCCDYLNLSAEFTDRVLTALADPSIQPDASDSPDS